MSHLPPGAPDDASNQNEELPAYSIPTPTRSEPTFDEIFTGPVATQDAAALRQRSRSERRASIDSRSKKPKGKGGLGCLIVLLVLVGIGTAGYFLLQGPIQQLISAASGPEDYEGNGSGEVIVMIHDGDIGENIAQTLVDQDVTKSFDAFYDLLLKQDPAPVFQPGAYKLASQMSAAAALDALMDPATRLEQTVVIPEGTVAADVLQLVSEGTEIPLADLQAAADVTSFGLPAEATTLEGFLFPATYTFTPGTTAHDALATMVNRQFEALDSAGVAPEARWKTIILASLIQKEAGLRDDFYKVSRVFLNRLDPAIGTTGQLLQSDATVAYGTGNTHRVSTTDAEREDANNLYNTYVHPGLPIGPISNPGDLAIDAALHPADGPWQYFVTWNLDTGETIFSETVEQHDAAVEQWLDWMDEHPEYE